VVVASNDYHFLSVVCYLLTDLKVENILFVDGCNRKTKDGSYLPTSTRIKSECSDEAIADAFILFHSVQS